MTQAQDRGVVQKNSYSILYDGHTGDDPGYESTDEVNIGVQSRRITYKYQRRSIEIAVEGKSNLDQ